MLSAEVTTDYTALGEPIRSPLLEDQIAEGVVTSASIRLVFSRFLLPSPIQRQSVCLHPSTESIEVIQDCVEPFQPFESPQYSPTDRAVTYRLPAGLRLDADTQYRLTVFATPTPDDGSGFFAFDGAPLNRIYRFDFRTQPDDTTAQDEAAPSPEAYCAKVACTGACGVARAACLETCDVTRSTCEAACPADDQPCLDACEAAHETCEAPCFDTAVACQTSCGGCFEASCTLAGDLIQAGMFRTCAFGQCHASDLGDPEAIAMGLDLKTAVAIRETAIGETAHQTQMGEESLVGDDNPLRFGRAMPLIDPGNPGNSYLLYKVVANDLTFVDGLDDEASLDPLLAEEIDRLRASVVVGLPMPAQAGQGPPAGINFGPEEISSIDSARLLDLWIASGAITSCDDL